MTFASVACITLVDTDCCPEAYFQLYNMTAALNNMVASSAQSACLYAGLGFEDCSARVTALSSEDLTSTKPYVKEHEEIQTRGGQYYSFDVSDRDYQVVVNIAEEESSKCEFPT